MYPNLADDLNKKSNSLDDRLKQVYVERTDKINPDQNQQNLTSKALPLDRKTPEDFEFGFQEPNLDNLNPGKSTLRQIMKLLTDHQEDPEKWTAKAIADEYKLKEIHVINLLKYFRPFNLHIPDKQKSERLLVEPGLSKKYLSFSKDDNQK